MAEDQHNPHVYPSGASDTALGITLRDYYAGEAPWDIPSWFTPVGIPTEPTIPMSPDEYFGDPANAASYNSLYIYYNSDTRAWDDAAYRLEVTNGVIDGTFKSQVSDYWGTYDYAVAVHNTWLIHYQKETYFQWRFFFASEMLMARNNENLS